MSRWRLVSLGALLAAMLGGGCHLHFWAGEHEVTIPPKAPTPTPSPAPTPEGRY